MAIKTNVGKILIMPKGAWSSSTTYYYLDMVTHNGAKWLCKAETCLNIEPTTSATTYWYAWDDSDIGGSPVDFTSATSRAELQSGETLSTLFGKIKKYFTDLSTVAFSGSFADLLNIPTGSSTTAGIVQVDGTSITASNGVISGVTADNALDTTSSNAIMNRVVATKIEEIEGEIGSGDGLIAEDYSATTSYAANDEVIYNKLLWRCLVACVGETPVEGTYWTNVTVGTELTSLNTNLSNLTKLLWTNPSPNSAFGTQSIALDLSDYNAVLVVFLNYDSYDYTTNSNLFSAICPVGDGLLASYITGTSVSGWYVFGVNRPFSTSKTAITFGLSKQFWLTGLDSDSSDYAIPYKIYGIK